jgi:FkbM family methyltransferase
VKPGHIVWDVGANQGLFSFAALAACAPNGRVVAFEPDPFLANLLCRTRRAQGAQSRLDVLPVAVSASSGLAAFSVAAKDRALNHLTNLAGNPRSGGERERLMVVTVDLEWLAARLPPPNVVKIDVEGGELEVLEGAGDELLRRIRPTWIIEVADENAGPLTQILRDANYRLFDAAKPMNEVRTPAWNTLAVPAEAL